MATKFTMPDTYNTTKDNGDPKSAATIAIYRTHLNKLAKMGFPDVEALLADPSSVIQALKAIPKGDDESEIMYKSRMRVYFSAIFMVLPAEVRAKKNAYYLANKKFQDGKPADFK